MQIDFWIFTFSESVLTSTPSTCQVIPGAGSPLNEQLRVAVSPAASKISEEGCATTEGAAKAARTSKK